MARDIVLEVSSLWDASAVGLTFTIPAGLLALARHFYKAPLPPGVWEGSLASNALMSGKLGEWPNAPPLLQLCLRVPVFIQGVMLLNLRTCVLPTFISIFQHGLPEDTTWRRNYRSSSQRTLGLLWKSLLLT